MQVATDAAHAEQPGRPPRNGGVFSYLIIPILVATVFPAFVLLTNQRIPFANNFHCDPWNYFGLFYLAGEPSVLNAPSREVSRVPEYLFGAIWTRVVPGVAADYANYLLFYVGSTLAAYFACLRLLGPVPAVIAVSFFGLNALVIGNLSTTLFAPSIFYSALAIWLASEARLADLYRRAIALMLCGTTLAFLIHGHLYTVFCAFAIPLYSFRLHNVAVRVLLVELIKSAVVIAAGFVAGTILIGAINLFAFGGPFLFFIPQIMAVSKINLAGYQIAGWFFEACRGAVISLALAVPALQIGALVKNGGLTETDFRIWSISLATLMIATALLLDNWKGGFFLQYDYYYVLLLPHVAISIATLYVQWTAARMTIVVLLAVYVAGLAFSILPTIEQISGAFLSPDNGFFSLGIAALIVVAISVGLFIRPRRYGGIALASVLILVDCLGFAVRPQRMGRQVWETKTRNLPEAGAADYARVRQAMNFLASYRLPSRPVFWVSIDEDHDETIALPRSFGYCVVEMNFPKLETAAVDFQVGRYMVIADGDASLADQANTVLAARKLRFTEIERKKIEGGRLFYYVALGRLELTGAGDRKF